MTTCLVLPPLFYYNLVLNFFFIATAFTFEHHCNGFSWLHHLQICD